MLDVYFSTDAFWSLTLAAIEVFKKECFGFLVGYRGTDSWLVQRAVPHQAAMRSYSWVHPRARARRRIETALRSLTTWEQTVGWFHSHPEWGDILAPANPSEKDIDFAREGEVVAVLAIHTRKKRVAWHQNQDGSISGTLGRHHLTLAAFVKVGAQKAKRLRVHCAFAHGFKPQ